MLHPAMSEGLVKDKEISVREEIRDSQMEFRARDERKRDPDF